MRRLRPRRTAAALLAAALVAPLLAAMPAAATAGPIAATTPGAATTPACCGTLGGRAHPRDRLDGVRPRPSAPGVRDDARAAGL